MSQIAKSQVQSTTSHLILGDPKLKTIYLTTNQAKFKEPQNAQISKLDEIRQKDLRSHHFTVGSYKINHSTVTKETYKTHEVNVLSNDEQLLQKQKMTENHHQFAESKYNYMASHYNQVYNQQKQVEKEEQQKIQDQIKERALQLRMSHVNLGNTDGLMKTNQQINYIKKEGEGQKVQKISSNQTNLNFGNQKSDFQTINNMFYTQQPFSKNKITQEAKNELRATHFTVGQEKVPFISEQQQHFKKNLPALGGQASVSIPNNQGDNFSLGDPNYKINYQSDYQKNMKSHPDNKKLDPINDKQGHISVGQVPVNYKSEFSKNYQHPTNYERAHLDENLVRDLKSHHFEFDDIKQRKFQTVQQAQYGNKQLGNNSLAENALQNLKKSHFTLGNDHVKIQSTNAASYKPQTQYKLEEVESIRQKLKATNFKLG